MTRREAIEILSEHNKWRRAEGEYSGIGAQPKYSARQIGLAMDFAIDYLNKYDDDAINAIMEESVLKAIQKTRKATVKKAVKWLKAYIIVFTETPSMLEDFKRAMEE